MECITRVGLIPDSLVTNEHLNHTNHIYGPAVLGIKGKGTKQKIPSISVDIIKVTPSITTIYLNVNACGDIFFFKKVALFGVISLNIQYGYEERFLNRHIPKFFKTIKHMRSRYALCSFLLRMINLNP